MSSCACGRPAPFAECCGPRLSGERPAETPEDLMRSRYVAFTRRDMDYLVRTLLPRRRKDFDFEANRAWASSVLFTRLEVLVSRQQGSEGFVEFRAHYLENFQPRVHHEKSRFCRQRGEWFFESGEIVDTSA